MLLAAIIILPQHVQISSSLPIIGSMTLYSILPSVLRVSEFKQEALPMELRLSLSEQIKKSFSVLVGYILLRSSKEVVLDLNRFFKVLVFLWSWTFLAWAPIYKIIQRRNFKPFVSIRILGFVSNHLKCTDIALRIDMRDANPNPASMYTNSTFNAWAQQQWQNGRRGWF